MIDKIDIEEVKRYLFQKGFKLESIDPVLNKGVSSNVFILRFIDGTPHYLKISHDNSSDYLVQKFITDQLRAKGVSTPEITFVDRFSAFDSKHVLIIDKLQGDSGTPSQWSKQLEVIAEQLSIINGVDVSGFGNIRVEGKSLYGQYRYYKDYFLSKFETFVGLLSYQIGETTIFDKLKNKYKGLIDSSVELEVGRLVHADIPGHVYMDNNLYAGIIDFDDVHSTLPFYDIFESELFLSRKTFERFLEAWERLSLLEKYCKYRILSEILFLVEESYYSLLTFKRLKRSGDLDTFTKMIARLERLSMN